MPSLAEEGQYVLDEVLFVAERRSQSFRSACSRFFGGPEALLPPSYTFPKFSGI